MNRTKVTKITKITVARITSILAPFIFISAFLVYAFIHHQRHSQFLTFGWDLAVFDQPIYLLSRGLAPFSSLHNMNTLGDHFHPLLLIAGTILYRIWADPRMLLWLETFVAVASAAVIFTLAKKVLRQPILALALSIMYLFSVGFQAMVLDDFHDDVLVTLPLTLLFLFLHQKNWLGYWLATTAMLLVKEEFGLLAAAIGLFIILKKISFKHGLITIVVGLTTFFLLLEVIMPQFNRGSGYAYKYRHYSEANQPQILINQFINQPATLVTTFFDHPLKRQTLLTAVTSFGFLPLLAPPVFALPILETLFIRFIDPTTFLRFAFNNHYNGPLLPLLAVAGVYGTSRLLRRFSPGFLTAWVIGFALLQNFLFHGPINSLFKPQFYRLTDWQQDAHELIRQVPDTGSLATQNFLLPHLSQRASYFLLPEVKDADYIAAVLNHTAPDFYGPPVDQLQPQLEALIDTNQYRVIWQTNQALLLKRN